MIDLSLFCSTFRVDAMRTIAVQLKHLYYAGALLEKPRRFFSRKNVREGLGQVSRVMANNQSQQ